jgi:hypothetical protein
MSIIPQNKKKFLAIIIIATTLGVWILFNLHQDKKSSPLHINEDTIFVPQLSREYEKGFEDESFFNYSTNSGPLHLQPKVICHTELETCVLDPLNSKIIIYNRDTEQTKEYEFTLPDNAYWPDEGISINQENTKFVILALNEVEFDSYEGQYYVLEIDPKIKMSLLKLENGKDTFFSNINRPLYFYQDRLITTMITETAFDIEASLLIQDEQLDLHTLKNKNYKIDKSNLKDNVNWVDTLIPENLDYAVVLEYNYDDGYWYVTKYPIIPK